MPTGLSWIGLALATQVSRKHFNLFLVWFETLGVNFQMLGCRIKIELFFILATFFFFFFLTVGSKSTLPTDTRSCQMTHYSNSRVQKACWRFHGRIRCLTFLCVTQVMSSSTNHYSSHAVSQAGGDTRRETSKRWKSHCVWRSVLQRDWPATEFSDCTVTTV